MYRVNGESTENISYCRHLKSGSLQIVSSENEADCLHINEKCVPLDSGIEEFDGAAYIRELEERLSKYEPLMEGNKNVNTEN